MDGNLQVGFLVISRNKDRKTMGHKPPIFVQLPRLSLPKSVSTVNDDVLTCHIRRCVGGKVYYNPYNFSRCSDPVHGNSAGDFLHIIGPVRSAPLWKPSGTECVDS